MPPVSRGRSFSTYLFDLDGTLIDSIGLIMSSFRHTMQAHLGTIPEEEEWRAGFGTPLRTQLEKFARNSCEVDEMVRTYAAYNNAHHDKMVEVYPGIHEILRVLRTSGTKLAIVTSKGRRSMWKGLTLCGLDQYFDAFVTVDDVVKPKPDPAPVVTALDRLKANSADAVFIGDSPHDVAAGHAAGVRTAAALWGPFRREEIARQEPDFWLDHPKEIAGLSRH